MAQMTLKEAMMEIILYFKTASADITAVLDWGREDMPEDLRERLTLDEVRMTAMAATYEVVIDMGLVK